MNMPKLGTAAAAILCAVLSTGCASGGGSASDGPPPEGSLEVQIWNRSQRTIDVFARWQSSPRVRLGQLAGNRRRTFTTGVRGPTMAISWDIVSGTPPSATAGAGAAFPRVADGTGNPMCPVQVEAGDRVEWTIEIGAEACSYVRLDPFE